MARHSRALRRFLIGPHHLLALLLLSVASLPAQERPHDSTLIWFTLGAGFGTVTHEDLHVALGAAGTLQLNQRLVGTFRVLYQEEFAICLWPPCDPPPSATELAALVGIGGSGPSSHWALSGGAGFVTSRRGRDELEVKRFPVLAADFQGFMVFGDAFGVGVYLYANAGIPESTAGLLLSIQLGRLP